MLTVETVGSRGSVSGSLGARARTWRYAAYAALHAVSGVYAGACLHIAVVDMRFIRGVGSEARVLETLKLALRPMGTLMLPQLLLMLALLGVLSVGVFGRVRRLWVPVALLLAIVLLTAIVHMPLNRRFLEGSVQPGELFALLDTWTAFHWLRTLLALALPYSIVRHAKRAVYVKRN